MPPDSWKLLVLFTVSLDGMPIPPGGGPCALSDIPEPGRVRAPSISVEGMNPGEAVRCSAEPEVPTQYHLLLSCHQGQRQCCGIWKSMEVTPALSRVPSHTPLRGTSCLEPCVPVASPTSPASSAQCGPSSAQAPGVNGCFEFLRSITGGSGPSADSEVEGATPHTGLLGTPSQNRGRQRRQQTCISLHLGRLESMVKVGQGLLLPRPRPLASRCRLPCVLTWRGGTVGLGPSPPPRGPSLQRGHGEWGSHRPVWSGQFSSDRPMSHSSLWTCRTCPWAWSWRFRERASSSPWWPLRETCGLWRSLRVLAPKGVSFLLPGGPWWGPAPKGQ